MCTCVLLCLYTVFISLVRNLAKNGRFFLFLLVVLYDRIIFFLILIQNERVRIALVAFIEKGRFCTYIAAQAFKNLLSEKFFHIFIDFFRLNFV